MRFPASVFTHKQFSYFWNIVYGRVWELKGLNALAQFAHNYGREKFNQE
jgi:hypothetical protein